ncbi:hypothetical protein Droror1_Dr00018286 [Drosera rotundifolia]
MAQQMQHVINVEALSYPPVIPRVPGLNFPFFEGSDEDDPRDWVVKCEEYFCRCGASEPQKLGLAVLHLRGKASMWYNGNHVGINNWMKLRKALCSRHEIAVLKKKLLKVKQKFRSVDNYHQEFVKSLADLQVRCRSATSQPVDSNVEHVSWLVDGLRYNIKEHVRKSKPETISEAVKTAKLVEECQNPSASQDLVLLLCLVGFLSLWIYYVMSSH